MDFYACIAIEINHMILPQLKFINVGIMDYFTEDLVNSAIPQVHQGINVL